MVATAIAAAVAARLLAAGPAQARIGEVQGMGRALFPNGAAPPASAIGPSLPYRPGEAILRLRPGALVPTALEALGADVTGGGRSLAALSRATGREYRLVRARGATTAQLLERLRADPAVAGAWPNWTYRAAALPDDPRFGELWGLRNTGQTVNGSTGIPGADVDAAAGWDIQQGSPEVVVAVVDSGIDHRHEDLRDNLWTNEGEIPGDGLDNDGNGYVDDAWGIDATGLDAYPRDEEGHGTHVAGTIAARGDNGRGIAGVGWRTRVMALKFLDSSGVGSSLEAIECILYAAAMRRRGVNVAAINASWGGYGGEDGDPLSAAIAEANAAGIAFVASAGNEGNDNDSHRRAYPASYDLPGIVAVAATGPDDRRASWSNYGVSSVDLAAPGVDVLSSVPGECYEAGPSDAFADDMEHGGGGWEHFGTNDAWALAAEGSHGGSFAWSDSPGGPVVDGADATLRLAQDLDLSGRRGRRIYLGFWARTDLPWQQGQLSVDVSADGPDGPWTSLGWIASNGETPSWERYVVRLPDAFLTPRFRVAFRLTSFGGSGGDGVLVDDVSIGEGRESSCYAFASGTSMAAPHVSGALALLAAQYPGDGLLERINRVTSGVDRLAALEPAVRTGGRLDLGASLSPDLVPEPWVIAADPARGLVPGAPLTVVGTGFGAAPGEVRFGATGTGACRAADFRVSFLLSKSSWSSGGVSLDDVTLSTEAGEVLFSDDAESGPGRWAHAGVPDLWRIASGAAHGGASFWRAESSGPASSLLTLAVPLDVSGLAGTRVKLAFWIAGAAGSELDALHVQAFPCGGRRTALLARVNGRSYAEWSLLELEIPLDDVSVSAPILSWSDRAVTAAVPEEGSGGLVTVRRAGGDPSRTGVRVSGWEARRAQPAADLWSRAVVQGAALYAFSGGGDLANWRRVGRYDPGRDVWSTVRTRPPRRTAAALASAGGRIYLAGGCADDASSWDPVDAVDSWDPRANLWRREARLPAKVKQAGAAAIGRSVYVVGGRDADWNALAATYAYDTARRRWRRRANLLEARADAGVVALRGKLYAFGGYGSAGELATAEVYDPEADAWTALPRMPVPLAGMGAATDGRRIFLAGGTSFGPYQPTGAFLVFDPAAAAWSWGDADLKTLDPPRYAIAALAFFPGRGLYVAGGATRTWRWDPVYRQTIIVEEPDGRLEQLDVQRHVPAVTILFPGGGERLAGGVATTVWWAAPQTAVRFTMRWSADGGATWRTVASDVPGTSWRWRVPRVRAASALLEVTGRDAAGNLVGSDRSAPFTIF